MKKVLLLGVILMIVLAQALTPVSAGDSVESTSVMKSWVKMLGYINSYGEDVASGLLRVHAKVEEWARVHALYVPGLNFSEFKIPREIPTNFAFSFHVVRLVNATEVKLNYDGNDFYVSGLWDVYNVTFVYYGNRNFTLTMETLVTDGSGELNVTSTWTEFTLDITGIELVEGKALFFCVVGFRPIPRGDVNCDRTVDIYDLVPVGTAYGFTLGTLNYNFYVDFNFDLTIDIFDLVALAVNYGKSY